MLYHIAAALMSTFSVLNVVHYVSFRALASLLSTFVLSLVFGSRFIDFSRVSFQNSARAFTPDSHQGKGSTPTMGGIFIVLMVLINMLLWCDWTKPDMWILALTLLGFGAIGLWDDLCKVWYKNGISARLKSRLQLVISLGISLLWVWLKNPSTVIYMPVFKGLQIDIGYLFIAWIVLVLIGTSNAVNLTDGLDGLAIGILTLNFVFFGAVAYLAGHAGFASYLQIPFAACSEVAIVAAILVGASLGFLWFNAHPAQIFMGDVGSLSLGGVLAMMAIMARQELLLIVTGGIFVIEALSVILQVFCVKTWKKRLFRMAPIHHHFEMIGWSESKVTIRFYIITIMLCLCGAIMLKVR